MYYKKISAVSALNEYIVCKNFAKITKFLATIAYRSPSYKQINYYQRIIRHRIVNPPSPKTGYTKWRTLIHTDYLISTTCSYRKGYTGGAEE
jgi:hypothetical protein